MLSPLQPQSCTISKFVVNCQTVRTISHSGTILHHFWQEIGTLPNLLQSCCFPGLQLHLHDGLMLQRRIGGGVREDAFRL